MREGVIVRPVVYLSAPSRDLDAAKGVLRHLWQRYEGADWIAPWISIVEAVGDLGYRERGLACDCEVVRRCDGLLLAGIPTPGMELELSAALASGVPFANVSLVPGERDGERIVELIDAAATRIRARPVMAGCNRL